MAERVSALLNKKRAGTLKVMSRLNDYMIEMKILIPMAADTRYCAERGVQRRDEPEQQAQEGNSYGGEDPRRGPATRG